MEEWVHKPGGTQNEAYNWSSPLVVGKSIYMGMSSQCDIPLIRGGERRFDQATGALLGTYYTVPSGSIGGSIWSSAAAHTSQYTYVTTGNADQSGGSKQGDSYSIVRLDTASMTATGKWTVPGEEES